MPAGFPTRKYEPLIIGSRAHDVGEVGGGGRLDSRTKIASWYGGDVWFTSDSVPGVGFSLISRYGWRIPTPLWQEWT